MGNTFLFLYISFTPKNLNSIFSQDEETLNNTHLSFNKRQTQHIQNVISTPLSHTSNPFPSSTRSSKGKCCEQSRIRNILHSLVWKEVDQGPYAYVKSPNLDPNVNVGEGGRERSASGSRSPRRIGEKDEPWHWHTKQRKMMKAEVEDAFRVRKWVVIFLVGFAISGVGLLLMIGWWVLGFWRNWEARVDGMREL